MLNNDVCNFVNAHSTYLPATSITRAVNEQESVTGRQDQNEEQRIHVLTSVHVRTGRRLRRRGGQPRLGREP